MEYTPTVLDHAQNPRNVGYVENADGMGQYGDPNCGDFALMTIQVKNGRITQCKYLVRGCGAATATCSIASEMATGRRLEEAAKIDDTRIVEALGGLPPVKLHCSLLAAGALQAAIQDYRRRSKVDLGDWRAMYQKRF